MTNGVLIWFRKASLMFICDSADQLFDGVETRNERDSSLHRIDFLGLTKRCALSGSDPGHISFTDLKFAIESDEKESQCPFHHHNRNLYQSALEVGQRNQETEDPAWQTAGECSPNGC